MPPKGSKKGKQKNSDNILNYQTENKKINQNNFTIQTRKQLLEQQDSIYASHTWVPLFGTNCLRK